MSFRSVLIAIVVAGALGGVVLLDAAMTRSNGGTDGATQTRTIGIDPARVVRVRVEPSGGEAQTASRREDSPSEWVVELDPDGAASWPARIQRVRGALRALATARLRVDDEPAENGDRSGIDRVVLTTRDGASVTLSIEPGSVAGRRRVRVTARDADAIVTRRWSGRMDSGITESILRDGLDPWRSSELFPMSRTGVGAVELRAGGSVVRLERTGSGWTITDPWRVGADQGAIDSLLETVLSLRADGFIPESRRDDAITGLDKPRATIAVEHRRSGETQRLSVGAPVSAGGGRVAARYDTGGAGVALEIAAESIGSLTAAPDAYIRRTPLRTAPSRIDSIRIEAPGASEGAWTATRDLDSWTSGGAPATPREEGRIDALLDMLANTPAREITPPGGSDPNASARTLRVRSLGDGEDARFALTIDRSGGEPALALRKQSEPGRGFVWVYRGAALKDLAPWIDSKLDSISGGG